MLASTLLIAIQASPKALSKQNEFSHPGGIAEISIKKESVKLPTARYGLIEPVILDQNTHWRILVGLDLNRLPGDYLIYFRPSGEDTTARFEKFQVTHKSYPLKNSSTKEPERLTEYEEVSELGFSNSQPPSLPLNLPFPGDWNNEFGSLHISSSDTTFAQNYTYFDSDPRTLVKTPQSGIISKIDTRKGLISTVIIDHGRGIFSLLHGLTDLTVELGNGVTVGAVIGKVPDKNLDKGNSRSSQAKRLVQTKSRVYWQVKLNNVFVNPLLLTQL